LQHIGSHGPVQGAMSWGAESQFQKAELVAVPAWLLAVLVPEGLPVGARPATGVAVGGDVGGHAGKLVAAIAIEGGQLARAAGRNLVDRPEGFHAEGDVLV